MCFGENLTSLSLKEAFNYCQIIYLSEQDCNNKKL